MGTLIKTLAIILLLAATLSASFFPGDSVNIPWNVRDTITGFNKNADTARYRVLQTSSETPVVDWSHVPRWDSANCNGKYMIPWKVPDTATTSYHIQLQIFQDGKTTPYEKDFFIKVDSGFIKYARAYADSLVKYLLSADPTGYADGSVAKFIALGGDTSLMATAGALADSLKARIIDSLIQDTAFARMYGLIVGDSAYQERLFKRWEDSLQKVIGVGGGFGGNGYVINGSFDPPFQNDSVYGTTNLYEWTGFHLGTGSGTFPVVGSRWKYRVASAAAGVDTTFIYQSVMYFMDSGYYNLSAYGRNYNATNAYVFITPSTLLWQKKGFTDSLLLVASDHLMFANKLVFLPKLGAGANYNIGVMVIGGATNNYAEVDNVSLQYLGPRTSVASVDTTSIMIAMEGRGFVQYNQPTKTLYLNQLWIDAATGPAVHLESDDDDALEAYAGWTAGNAFSLYGRAPGGAGFFCYGADNATLPGAAMLLRGGYVYGKGAPGFQIWGRGNSPGLLAYNDSTASGIESYGGPYGGYGFYTWARGGNYNGWRTMGKGSAAGTAFLGERSAGNTTASDGFYIESGLNTTTNVNTQGNGIRVKTLSYTGSATAGRPVEGWVLVNDTTAILHNVLGNVRYGFGADSTWILRRFVASGANGSLGSFYITNTTGDGAIVTGSQIGFKITGGGYYPAWACYGGTSGGQGAVFNGFGIASGMDAIGWGTGYGFHVQSYGNHAFLLDAGLGDFYGITSGGKTLSDVDTLRHAGGISITLPDTISATIDSVAAGLIASIMVDTATQYPSVFGAGTGSGANVYTIYVRDTSSDVMVPHTLVSAYSLSGMIQSSLYTDTYGKVTFQTDLDSVYIVLTRELLYSSPDTIPISPFSVDTVLAYSRSVNPNMALVFIKYMKSGRGVSGAALTIRNNNVATDSTSGAVIGPFYAFDITDATGLASVYVPKSYIYSDSSEGLYTMELKYGGKIVKDWNQFYVSDRDTVRITTE